MRSVAAVVSRCPSRKCPLMRLHALNPHPPQEIARMATSSSQNALFRSTVALGGSGSPLDVYFERARARSAAAAVAAGPSTERDQHVRMDASELSLYDDVVRVAACVLERVQESRRVLDQGGARGHSGSSRHSRRRFDLDTVRRITFPSHISMAAS